MQGKKDGDDSTEENKQRLSDRAYSSCSRPRSWRSVCGGRAISGCPGLVYLAVSPHVRPRHPANRLVRCPGHRSDGNSGCSGTNWERSAVTLPGHRHAVGRREHLRASQIPPTVSLCRCFSGQASGWLTSQHQTVWAIEKRR
jgi:hypothetical protein